MPFTASGQAPPGAESLGEVHFGASCGGEVEASFDRAVALLHHMTYSRARSEFAAIAADHPGCAMAHWGIAMTLFQPLWPTRPGDADLRRGRDEIEQALAIGPRTERDRMLVNAAAAFFEPGIVDYWDRIAGWADVMRSALDAYPDDIETRVFFALSHLATAPTTGGLAHNAFAADVLRGVLEAHPAHPGAIHYTIHANDAAGRERESLDVVRRYGQIAPRNPHALHMPTHIYVRLGEWQGVIDGNREAAAAALESPAGDAGQWVWDEFPHAIEYLVYAALQVGDDSLALGQMRRLQQTADLQPSFKTAFHLSSIPARYALERHDWRQASELVPRPEPGLPWDRFAWPEAVTWFARGLGSINLGNEQAGREAEARLGELRDVSAGQGEELFARQTEILRLGVASWLAHSEGGEDRAVRLMEEAVRLESSTPKHPVTPAPTLPAAELLGDLLLDADRPAAALDAYRSSLESGPGRFNSLVGAARAARRMGDAALAMTYYRAVLASAVPQSSRPELAEANDFVKSQTD